MSKKLFKKILPYALTVAGYAVGGPAGAAVASGGYNYSQTHNVGSALLNAGGSYVGSNVGGALAGGTGGTVGNALNTAIGPSLGSSVLPMLGGDILGANVGASLGSFAGGQIGGDLASSLIPEKTTNPVGETAAPAFKPTREAEMGTPLSLQSLGSLTPNQLTSNVATGGVYGGGAGPDEQEYFQNMINRRLVDDAGNVDQNLSDINPIESSYLSQLGMGGYSDATSLLEVLSKRKKAA